MAPIRIAAAGLSYLLLAAVMLTSAAAQSAADGAAGKPLPLLQFLRHKSKAKPAPHRKLPVALGKKPAPHRKLAVALAKKPEPHPRPALSLAKKKESAKFRIAKRAAAKAHRAVAEARPVPAPIASANVPENLWPAGTAAMPGEMPTLSPNQASPAVVTEPVVDTSPNQIVTGGHAVPAALPNGLNGIDPSADHVKTTAQATVTASAASTPAVHAMVVKVDPQSPIGSASWIAHILAALGGAIAAGAVAWFLIRPAPERTYG